MYSKHIFPTILGCIELLPFKVIPRIPHPSLVCPDHRENGSVGPGGKKDRMIDKHPKCRVFGVQFGDG